ncbi:hypothetical protein AAHA92_08681 [Salvia divinorum]|uniref:Uncharacterized protein n=1 Tax=Salvia divinorum TaxID=28513 RepID=A0ABD1HP40_SALDI
MLNPPLICSAIQSPPSPAPSLLPLSASLGRRPSPTRRPTATFQPAARLPLGFGHLSRSLSCPTVGRRCPATAAVQHVAVQQPQPPLSSLYRDVCKNKWKNTNHISTYEHATR